MALRPQNVIIWATKMGLEHRGTGPWLRTFPGVTQTLVYVDVLRLTLSIGEPAGTESAHSEVSLVRPHAVYLA